MISDRRRSDIARSHFSSTTVAHSSFSASLPYCPAAASVSALSAASTLATPPRFVFASSYTVHGPRNGARELPLLTATTPVAPADAYAGHKVEAELLLRRSGLPWVVLRVGTCLPFTAGGADPRTLRMVFELPRGIDDRRALALHREVRAKVIHGLMPSVSACSRVMTRKPCSTRMLFRSPTRSRRVSMVRALLTRASSACAARQSAQSSTLER